MRFHESVKAHKRSLIVAALSANKNNRTHAARALGLQRTYLHRLMCQFKVHAPSLPAGRPKGGTR
jgi:transcriptional regulator with GAF, ATPase, and Fis domain